MPPVFGCKTFGGHKGIKQIDEFFRLQNTEEKNKKDSENGNYPET